MAAVHWKKAVSGDWTTAADWSTGAVPGAGDSATIGIAGVYTVFLTTPITVHSITIGDTGATLAIGDPGQTDAVTASLTNSGTLTVDGLSAPGGSTLTVGGTLTNNSGGALAIGNAGITANATVTAHGFSNAGAIDLTGGATARAKLTVDTAGSNTGTISLVGPAALYATADFTNGGTLQVDASGTGGSVLSIVGTLTSLRIPLVERAVLDIGNSALTTAAKVTVDGLSGNARSISPAAPPKRR